MISNHDFSFFTYVIVCAIVLIINATHKIKIFLDKKGKGPNVHYVCKGKNERLVFAIRWRIKISITMTCHKGEVAAMSSVC